MNLLRNDLFKPIEAIATKFPNSAALITPDGQKLSYQKLCETIKILTVRVADAGIGVGDHVVIDIPNYVVKLCLILAMSRLGAVNMIGDDVRGFQKAEIKIDYIISNTVRFGNSPASVLFSQDWLDPIGNNTNENKYSGFAGDDEPALICATSGTTGQRKYVYLSISNLLHRIPLYCELLNFKSRSMLLTMPIESLVGLSQALRILHGGGLFMGAAGSPKATLELMEEYGVEELFASPNSLADLVTSQENSAVKISSLNYVTIAGSELSSSLAAKISKHICDQIYCLYGATETGPVVGGRIGDSEIPKGAIGAIAPWAQIEVVDEPANAVSDGVTGTVRVSVPSRWRVKDYIVTLGNEKGDSIKGRWFYPGDWGRIIDQKYFSLSGRLDDRINIGGNKFSAIDVEEWCLEHPAVSAVAAIGIKNESGFEDIAIGYCGDSSKNISISQWVRKRFGNSAPVQVMNVPKIPTNSAGKPDKLALRKLFESSSSK